MGRKRVASLLVLAASMVTALLVASPALALQVSLTAEPKLKRTHSWKVEKSVSQPALTVKAGETADVTYTVTATPLGFVDSDFRVDGIAHFARDDETDVTDVIVNIRLLDGADPIAAAVSCDTPFPIDLAVSEIDCEYSAALPDTTPRKSALRATLVGGTRTATEEFDFTNATVESVDESVTVTDTMGGTLGTAAAADGPKTFTYTKTLGPFTTAQCGQQTVDNTATSTAVDSGKTVSASAAVTVTVTCPPPPPPKPRCALPSLVWGFVTLVGPSHVKPLLPITLGTAGGAKTLNIATTSQALGIFAQELFTTNGIDLLETELLTAKLNAAAGRDVSSVASTMAAADAFLATTSSWSWSTLSSSKRSQVNGWMNALEAYNNQCIPDKGHGEHDHCKQHWDKPGHDWKNWSWQRYDWDD